MVLSHPVYCLGCFQQSPKREFFNHHIIEQDIIMKRNGQILFVSRDPNTHHFCCPFKEHCFFYTCDSEVMKLHIKTCEHANKPDEGKR